MQTKRELLAPTIMLLADQDYHAITLDRVAKAVGVAKTGILWHFDSKEGLLVAAVLDMFEELENAIVVEKSSLPTLNVRVARVRPFSRRGDRRKLADLLSSDEEPVTEEQATLSWRSSMAVTSSGKSTGARVT